MAVPAAWCRDQPVSLFADREGDDRGCPSAEMPWLPEFHRVERHVGVAVGWWRRRARPLRPVEPKAAMSGGDGLPIGMTEWRGS